MTYEEVFEKASKLLKKAKTKDITEHIAVQFNIEGEGSGAFYAEITEGKTDVQPFDYKDNDISVNIGAEELIAALESKKGDTLPFYGNKEKLALLKPALAGIPKARKPAVKKTEEPAEKKAEKKTAKKTTSRKTAKKTEE